MLVLKAGLREERALAAPFALIAAAAAAAGGEKSQWLWRRRKHGLATGVLHNLQKQNLTPLLWQTE
jgi:hypothetical protein